MSEANHLDCHDLDTMLASVSRATGRLPNELEDALRAFEEGPSPADNWHASLTRGVLASLGSTAEDTTFAGTYWFHGTRTLDAGRLEREGLLPLPQVLDSIWDRLHDLIREEIPRNEWDSFRRCIEEGGGGHYADLYRLKLGRRSDHGPHGELVREVILRPNACGSHDYLRTPEIVEDIAIEAGSRYDIDVATRFAQAAEPCCVTFRSSYYNEGVLGTALAYGYQLLSGDGLSGRVACLGYPGEGVAVPPADVVSVETGAALPLRPSK